MKIKPGDENWHTEFIVTPCDLHALINEVLRKSNNQTITDLKIKFWVDKYGDVDVELTAYHD